MEKREKKECSTKKMSGECNKGKGRNKTVPTEKKSCSFDSLDVRPSQYA